MQLKNYETVFILTPVLSDEQMKEAVTKFEDILKSNDAEIINREEWGLRKLAYPIQAKKTGFYSLVEFKASATIVDALETEFRRDDRVLRFLTTALEPAAVEYNEKRRKGEFNKKKETTETKEG
ncbi:MULTISPECIES: 30S ribosomal protein S6 [Persicobacter]|uniref:Small ribosomal subunit protein bS6 n=1 Tax=Persicobacter diffluens TaxID=981 RepID=A0AAN4VX66_9BACT|nr:30S ribosomal protein S6 [Persicobacter sp. CCB-QB2]GJM60390.1 30S ribosomal protein S6 [Persicobacter diffluens]